MTIKSNQENFTKNMVRQNTKIDGLKVDTNIIINNVRNDFKDRIQDLDEFYNNNLKEMHGEIEKVRNMTNESVHQKEKELTELISDQVVHMRT